MNPLFQIRPISSIDIPIITEWARTEGFAPGVGDVNIYRNTDKQGIWIGCLDDIPIGCIAGVRYNPNYGFIGLFIVRREYRGKGYGLELWKHALEYLKNTPLIGLEAATSRIEDYQNWGFRISSITTRWQCNFSGECGTKKIYEDEHFENLRILDGKSVKSNNVQLYDANREPSPRPHFLSDWLDHIEGNVSVLVDDNQNCHGFGRIRPCLLSEKNGWRIGPLLADTPPLAEIILSDLLTSHSGQILLDAPGSNPYVTYLLKGFGFKEISHTYRMYRGNKPKVSMNQVYGLACLELG